MGIQVCDGPPHFVANDGYLIAGGNSQVARYLASVLDDRYELRFDIGQLCQVCLVGGVTAFYLLAQIDSLLNENV